MITATKKSLHFPLEARKLPGGYPNGSGLGMMRWPRGPAKLHVRNGISRGIGAGLEDESVLGPWDPQVAGARAGTAAVESVSGLSVSLYHLSLWFHSSAHFLNYRSQLVSVR